MNELFSNYNADEAPSLYMREVYSSVLVHKK